MLIFSILVNKTLIIDHLYNSSHGPHIILSVNFQSRFHVEICKVRFLLDSKTVQDRGGFSVFEAKASNIGLYQQSCPVILGLQVQTVGVRLS